MHLSMRKVNSRVACFQISRTNIRYLKLAWHIGFVKYLDNWWKLDSASRERSVRGQTTPMPKATPV